MDPKSIDSLPPPPPQQQQPPPPQQQQQHQPPPQPLPPPPTTTTTTDLFPNHTAHVANPTPSLPQTLNHPPYAEMICAAIGGLKEKNGSSKRAIAKYIEKVYTNLPPTHSALLTHHLKRLKNNGHLVMVKKSYKLASSLLPLPNTTTNTTTTATTRSDALVSPNNIALLSVPLSPSPLPTSSSGPIKKGRGRPAKPKPNDIIHPGPVLQPALVKRNPGRPPKNGPGVGPGVGPMVPMVKKGRGRPPKTGPIGPKKSPGRPRKPKSLAAPNGLKRGRGRPPKALALGLVQAQPKAMNVPYVVVAAAGGQNVMRPRGRPKKAAANAPAAAAVAGGGVVVPGGKPRGRPPKVDGVISPKKPKNSTGRPVGRPKKNGAAGPQQVAYADLKRKLEFLQFKIKQAVGVLRPQFTSESDISAIAAFQELEGLAAMDISTPLREEPQPQPPLL